MLDSCSVVVRVVVKYRWRAEVFKLLSSNEKGRQCLTLYLIVGLLLKTFLVP